MAIRRIYQVTGFGEVSEVAGLDDKTVRQVSCIVSVEFPGGRLEVSDDNINLDVSIAAEIRKAFEGTSLAEVPVFDSLDVPDSSGLRECAVMVELTSGLSWESAGFEQANIRSAIELRISVLAPAERAALVSARAILLAAIQAVVV